jgi:hypothetical protein
MCARPALSSTPSLAEFEGWYNIADQYDDGVPVLRTSDDVPEFWHVEIFELYTEAEAWFGQLVAARPNEPFDPLAPPPFFVVSDADDRTLSVETDFSYLTLDVLNRIQREFLRSNPLWRVVLFGEHRSVAIVVYPTAIRFGTLPADVDPTMGLQQVTERQLELRAIREAPARAHLAQMQRLLPAAVRAIAECQYWICGVLDNYCGDYSRLTVLLLTRAEYRYAISVESPFESDNEFLWTSSTIGVSAEGTVVSYIGVPDGVPYCLIPWMPPAEYRGPLWIVERETGHRHRFEVKDEEIIRTKGDPI